MFFAPTKFEIGTIEIGTTEIGTIEIAGEVELRGGFVGFGNTAPAGQLLVLARAARASRTAREFHREHWRGLHLAEGW